MNIDEYRKVPPIGWRFFLVKDETKWIGIMKKAECFKMGLLLKAYDAHRFF